MKLEKPEDLAGRSDDYLKGLIDGGKIYSGSSFMFAARSILAERAWRAEERK